MIYQTINKVGLAEIATFVRENHKDGERIADDESCLAAWATEAEESIDGGNTAMIEIRSFESVSKATVTYTVSGNGIATEEIE